MALKAATRRNQRVIGTPTCKYWLAGRCNRNPCRFLHRLPSPSTARCNAYSPYTYIRPHSKAVKPRSQKAVVNYDDKEVVVKMAKVEADATTVAETTPAETTPAEATPAETTPVEASQKPSPSICKYWKNDNCVQGDQCQNLHSWSYGDRISSIAKLKEHKKMITGITLPAGKDKLYSGSNDGTLRVWDCHTGRCVNVINLGSEITSLISEGPWIFAGVKNAIKVWNVETAAEFTLDGPKGQVLSMVTYNDNTLFAGAEDGVIYAWRGRCDAEGKCPFELVASLCGHTKAVTCLSIGRDKLYSGSIDRTIKVWDAKTLDCEMTLGGHTNTVTSLICWDTCLISSSLDSTCKFWIKTEDGRLKVEYTHTEENGILALSGMNCSDGKHILFVSCKDSSVRMYELPILSQMGQLFARQDVRSVEMGPDGLFFTGDETGLITVWKWLDEPKLPSF